MAITLESLQTNSRAIVLDDRVCVEDATVKEIKDVASYNRGECHSAPILGKTADPKRVGHQRWVDPKVKTISQAGQSRNED